jgi:hypothetical protein
MVDEGGRSAEADPGNPAYDVDLTTVNHDLWDRVREGFHVVSVDGEHLGVVRDKSEHVFEVEAPRGLLTTEELYIPHIAVARVDGDQVTLSWNRQQLIDAYDHFRRYHTGQRPGA